jgi:hypothetical protein
LIPLVFVLVGGGGIYFTRRSARWKQAPSAGGKWLPKQSRMPAEPTRRIAAIPAVSADEGPVVLNPTVSPWVKLIGMIFVATFWNGIVSVFVFQAIKGWQHGSPEWFLAIFLIPFVLIGLVMIGAIGYFFLALFNPRPVLTVSARAVRLGDALDLQWRMHGRTEVMERLRIYLEGREEATYRRGTSTSTDKEIFATIDLANVAGLADKRAGQCRVTIPANTMHSFESDNNKIIWRLKVHGTIRRWPDVNEEFPVALLPANSKPPMPT